MSGLTSSEDRMTSMPLEPLDITSFPLFSATHNIKMNISCNALGQNNRGPSHTNRLYDTPNKAVCPVYIYWVDHLSHNVTKDYLGTRWTNCPALFVVRNSLLHFTKDTAEAQFYIVSNINISFASTKLYTRQIVFLFVFFSTSSPIPL